MEKSSRPLTYRPPSPESPRRPRSVSKVPTTPTQEHGRLLTPKAPKHAFPLHHLSFTPAPPPSPIYKNMKVPVCPRRKLFTAQSEEDEDDPFSENYVPTNLRRRRKEVVSDGWSDSSDDEDLTMNREERDRWGRLPGQKGSDLVLVFRNKPIDVFSAPPEIFKIGRSRDDEPWSPPDADWAASRKLLWPAAHIASVRASGQTTSDVNNVTRRTYTVPKMMDPDELSDAEDREELEAEVHGLYTSKQEMRIVSALDVVRLEDEEETDVEDESLTELEDENSTAESAESEVDYTVDETMQEEEEDIDVTFVSQTAPESTSLDFDNASSGSELEGEITLVGSPSPRRPVKSLGFGSPRSVKKNPFQITVTTAECRTSSIFSDGLKLKETPYIMPTPESLPRKKTADFIDFAGLGKRKRGRDPLFG